MCRMRMSLVQNGNESFMVSLVKWSCYFFRIVANEDSCCMYQNLTSSSKIHPQREYYMFDSHLVLPEYMIYIKYEKYETSNSKNQSDSDNDIINMSPQPEIRPKLVIV